MSVFATCSVYGRPIDTVTVPRQSSRRRTHCRRRITRNKTARITRVQVFQAHVESFPAGTPTGFIEKRTSVRVIIKAGILMR